MRFVRTTMSLVAALGLSTSALAQAPLNLVPGTPDVASGFIAVDYNATTQLFTAEGFTQNLNLPPTMPLGQRQFRLTAIINNAGQLTGPGTLTVRGDYLGTDQLLFSSNDIDAFGYDSFNRFEFLFTQQAGNLAPAGASVGTILADPNLSFPGGVPNFTSSFSGRLFPGGPGAAVADTFIPAPGALPVTVLAGAAMMRRRRRA
jgi:hypothetical protein